jgi:hypothetical protein
MRVVRTIVGVLFAVTITVTGCTAPPHADQPSPPPPAPDITHGAAPPTHRADPDPVPIDRIRVDRDRQALIYAAVLRRYLTSGGGHDGGDAGFGGQRFPRIFVLDHPVAGASATGHGASGSEPIPAAVRRVITRSLADVAPLTFVPSGDAVIVDRQGCAQVRDQGILITLGPVDGVGDQVQVSINGFVACLGASSLTYRVERTSGGWRVAGVAAQGPVA